MRRVVKREQSHELEADVGDAAEEEDVHFRSRRLEEELFLSDSSVCISR